MHSIAQKGNRSVVFAASHEYGNLGIGYMASMLGSKGFETTLIDIRNSKESFYRIIKELNPVFIGLSVIYQYNIGFFIDLVGFLRKHGVSNHITAGGHYASLRFEDLFRFIPSLDSVVRFEGEYTITEMAEKLYRNRNWKTVRGIAFREADKVIANPLRPPEKDLDRFPYPMRAPLGMYAFNRKMAVLVAGRGCIHNCSFCNQKEFYIRSGGPAKRIRRPENVVGEMRFLHEEKNASVILIEDDDFPVKTGNGSGWVAKFCDELKKNRLDTKLMWKINCRPDEVEEKTFRMMQECGLFKVFLGIEDGTDSGLKRLNKHMTVSKSLKGINTLKKLGIGFDYGFLLFQPLTTFVSLLENIGFLRAICGDGYTPATFLKLMPYYETRVEKELLNAGRIKGKPGFFDYEFIEGTMNGFYSFITKTFHDWFTETDGLANQSKWALNYFAVDSFYYGFSHEVEALSQKLRMVISESNLFLFATMEKLAEIFKSGKSEHDSGKLLESYAGKIHSRHRHFCTRINKIMTELLVFARDFHGADVYYHGLT